MKTIFISMLLFLMAFMSLSSASAHHFSQSDMAGLNIPEHSPHLLMEF